MPEPPWQSVPPLGSRYQLLAPVGAGGFGLAFKALDLTLERIVAVKILRPDLLNDPDFVARFLHEARMLASVTHPNVVDVYDFGADAGICYLVMQFVPGRSLADELSARGRFAPAEAVRVAVDILSGLGAIHRAGIIHRDIKPQNVLLGDGGAARVTDLGIARHRDNHARTRTSGVLGTPLYMAPEQARGEPVTPAADLYAVGVMLFELLTGQLPFGTDPSLAMYRTQFQPPPSPAKLAPDVYIPPLLEVELMRAMAKDPAQRHRSAADMAQALERAMEPTAAETVTSPAPPRTVPWAAFALLLFLLATYGSLAVAAFQRLNSGAAPTAQATAGTSLRGTEIAHALAAASTATATVTPTATAPPTPLPTATVTATPLPTPTPRPSPTTTATPLPSPSPTVTATATPSPASAPPLDPVAVAINSDPRNGGCDEIGSAVSGARLAGEAPIDRAGDAMACAAGNDLVLLGACVEPNRVHPYAVRHGAIVACELRMWSNGYPALTVGPSNFTLVDQAGEVISGDPRSFCQDAGAARSTALPTGSYLRCFIDFPVQRNLHLPFLVEYRPAIGPGSDPPPTLTLVVDVVEPVPRPTEAIVPPTEVGQDCRVVSNGRLEVRVNCDEAE